MNTFDKIDFLLKEKGLKQIDLTNYLGVPKAIYTGWKTGRTKSYQKHLSKIADFFGVSVDYLLGKTETTDPDAPTLSPEKQKIIVDRISGLCEEKSVSINQMLKETNLNKSLVDNLKKGSIPSVDKIECVADYFGVSVDYLLGKTEQKEKPTAKGGEPNDILFNEAAALMERLSPEAQGEAMRYLRYLASQSTKSEDNK